jgi:hypothetical protein
MSKRKFSRVRPVSEGCWHDRLHTMKFEEMVLIDVDGDEVKLVREAMGKIKARVNRMLNELPEGTEAEFGLVAVVPAPNYLQWKAGIVVERITKWDPEQRGPEKIPMPLDHFIRVACSIHVIGYEVQTVGGIDRLVKIKLENPVEAPAVDASKVTVDRMVLSAVAAEIEYLSRVAFGDKSVPLPQRRPLLRHRRHAEALREAAGIAVNTPADKRIQLQTPEAIAHSLRWLLKVNASPSHINDAAKQLVDAILGEEKP